MRMIEKTDAPSLSVSFLLLPDFTLTAFASAVDVLRLAADEADHSRQIRCQWNVLASPTGDIRSSCGVRVSPTAPLSAGLQADYVAVVGGLLRDRPRLGAAEAQMLRQAADQRSGLIGICTGSFELLELGLMRGRRCCVSWFHADDLVQRFDDVVPVTDRPFVSDGQRITCAGGAGAAHLMAHLVAKHGTTVDAEKALRILHITQLQADRLTQPVSAPFGDIAHAPVRRALLLIESRLSNPPGPAELAVGLGLSRRQLERQFRQSLGLSPAQASRKLRLHFARQMLETQTGISEIAAATGFSSSGAFSRHFKQHYGHTPSHYKKAASLS